MKKNAPKLANIGYNGSEINREHPNGIVECNSEYCMCCAEKCVNHVVQKGIL